jgi:uncharacterized protein YeaO (DUF488 family)
LKKEGAHIDLWLKEIAPTTGLRQWFNHHPPKWKMFQSRYQSELKSNPAVDRLRHLADSHATISLLYSAKEERYNHAQVLKDLLERQ